MGYTLRAALDNLPKKAKITVAEIVPAVVRWNRTVLAGLANDPLSDERVEIQEQDVAGLIKCVKNRYNGIILDVDNGPAGLSKK
jgi:spermidine synthase